MAIISNITALQTAIVNRLLGDSFFQGAASPVGKPITVIAHQPGQIAALSSESVAKQIGLAVVVMTPIGKNLNKQKQVPNLSVVVPVKILVSENGAANQGPQGTQVAATDVIGRCLELLHFWPHGLIPDTYPATELNSLLMDSDPWSIASVKDPMNPQYFVNLYCYLPIKTTTV